MKKITLFALFCIIGAFSTFVWTELRPSEGFGTALPSGTAIFETSLASPITDSATSMTLAANTIRGGGSLSGYECFTIDEGSAQAEFVCGTVSGTSVTNLERGISPADGITENPDLQFSHRRGASVKITDFPLLQRLKLQASGEGTYNALLSYAAGVTPISASNLTDVEYVLSVVNGGTVSFDRMVVTGTAGSPFATGTIVYKSLSDGRWYPADADETTTYIDRVIGIAQSPGATGTAISRGVLLRGFDNTVTGLTANTRVFLSSTAGAATTTTGAQFLGVAESASSFLFLPIQLESTYRAPITFAATTTFTGFVSGATRVTATEYTASTTWTKQSGLQMLYVQAWGGGGSGASATGPTAPAGGGGGCGYAERWIHASELPATTSISVGAGGAAVSGNSNGNAGGNSTFGSFVTAFGGSAGTVTTGGNGGLLQLNDTTFRGAGGAAAAGGMGLLFAGGGGGDNGNNGGSAFYGCGGGGGTDGIIAGVGGTSVFGGAGGTGSGSGNGTAGSFPGGGGGATDAGTSGAGGNGRILIYEFY